MATEGGKRPSPRGAAKRGREVETKKVALFVKLVNMCLQSADMTADVYELADYARAIGMTRGNFRLTLKRMVLAKFVNRPKKSTVDCRPLLRRLFEGVEPKALLAVLEKLKEEVAGQKV